MQQIIRLPSYFVEKGYLSPVDSMDCPFQYAMNTKLHALNWVAKEPKIQQASNIMMTIHGQKHIGPKWYDTYPVHDLLGQERSFAQAFFVDIGGGVGHMVIPFKKDCPQA
jgi:hypothetical protein